MYLFYIILFLFFLILYLDLFYINIKFYSKYELSYLLSYDLDNYYHKLNKKDLEARNITNIYEYLINIDKNLCNFTNTEKQIIKQAIYKAHNKLKNLKYPGFNYNKIKTIPWNIGCVNNNNYEFGLPHTRNKNIIIINKNNIFEETLYKTLIHEKIHVYQKTFPNEINEFLNYYNFTKYRLKSNLDRANPDLDNYIYKKNNIILQCNTNNKCTFNSYIYEHPFELMAYDIVNKIV